VNTVEGLRLTGRSPSGVPANISHPPRAV